MPTSHSAGIYDLREQEISVREYNGAPAVHIGTTTFYAGGFGRATSRDLRDESAALNKLAQALSDLADWCLEQSDIKLGEELAAERKAEAAKRRLTDFADLLPSAAIDFVPNLDKAAS